ncbi:MAG: 2-amino-3,7-dideoxy-D-threo-hept-6-ulosonate synthase [Nitrososphaerales archaeon]
MGKNLRISRLTKNGKMLCIPMDHGISIGPVKGLDTIYNTIQLVAEGGASAILIHKGILKALSSAPNTGIIMHLSASTDIGPSPNRKMLIAGVEEAIRLGADAVSVHINIGCKDEPEMLQDLGLVADECDSWGMPLIAMMYPRGENIKNPYDPDTVAHVARIGAEAGADIVKTVYTGSSETFSKVVRGCPVPVVIAGGPKVSSDREVLLMAKGALEAGAMGVTFGRNVFQHSDPRSITKALSKVVFERLDVDEALKVVGQ